MKDLKALIYIALAGLLAFNHCIAAQEPEAPPPAEAPAAPPQAEAPAAPPAAPVDDPDWDFPQHRGKRNVIVHLNQDSNLPAGQTAEAVISIGGSSTAAGDVLDSVVAIMGNTHVSGRVGDSVVAIFGNTYVNSRVNGDAVAIFGNVELGPQARIAGDVSVVGGQLIQDPDARVRGSIEQVVPPIEFGGMQWLRPWISHCLLLGRPLALEPGLGWAWTLAFGFLTLYVVLALMFSGGVEKCVQTLETRPGHSLLAALLTLLLVPVLSLLLMITVVGIALLPFLWMALFAIGLFGKAVILAAIGRRVTGFIGSSPLNDIAFAVLVGGLIVIGLYLVPVLGFIAYKLIGILGLGVVIYTLMLTVREKREGQLAAAATAGPAPRPAASGPTTASTAAATGAAAAAAAGASVSGADESAAAAEPAQAAPETSEPAAAAAGPTAAPTVDVTALPRAGFWIRMLALFIDVLLIGIAFSVLHSDNAFLLALAAYGAIMWKLKGTTIGGILCNLKVVRVDGRELDWSTTIVRALSCFLSLIVAGLGFLWIVFDDGRQAWHDKIAGTAVVRVPQGVSLL